VDRGGGPNAGLEVKDVAPERRTRRSGTLSVGIRGRAFGEATSVLRVLGAAIPCGQTTDPKARAYLQLLPDRDWHVPVARDGHS
jgi:hypothetical protein